MEYSNFVTVDLYPLLFENKDLCEIENFRKYEIYEYSTHKFPFNKELQNYLNVSKSKNEIIQTQLNKQN